LASWAAATATKALAALPTRLLRGLTWLTRRRSPTYLQRRRADAAATPHAHHRAHRTRAPITAPIAHDAGDSRAPVRRQPRPRHAKRA
jgi:hypothetical protein